VLTDQAQAQQLFDALFDPEDIVELRFLPSPNCKHKPQSKFFNSPDEAIYDWEWITERIEDGYDVYFGANPRSERSGKAASITYARCLFVDFDDAKTVEEVRERIAGLPQHTAIVSSGRGFHVYWRLVSRENDMQRWTMFQKAIIAHCKSDRAIHDPPRIMRLPGTINHKNGSTCTVVESTGHRIAEDLAQAFPTPKKTTALWDTPQGAQKVLEGECLPLPRDVQDWLTSKTPYPEGTRHDMLVKAAVAVIANGWPEKEGLDAVRRAAERDGKDLDEISNVFSFVKRKKKEEKLTPSPNNEPRVLEPADDTQPEVAEATSKSDYVRPFFSNVIRQRDMQSDKEQDFYKPVDLMAEELRRATGGWPALAKGVMFYPTGTDEIPFRTINNPSQLFAYVYAKTSPRWVSNKDLMNISDRTWRSTISKQEFYEFLSQGDDDYAGIEILPHEPPIEGIWYAPMTLPPPSGRLDELLERMNGETDLDNQLIKAMLATPFAGVPAGSRPMFIIRSRFGVGTGKTTTCDIAVSLAGLACDTSTSEDWDKIARKLVDENGLSGRIVRIDNAKGGRFSSPEFESAITAPVVAGHRLFKGQSRRPNNLTFIMTANTPNLSTDLASRAVVINIGGSKHADTGFKAWLDAFLAKHRLELISDLLHWLRSPKHEIDPEHNGRFAYWTDAVLSRFENANEVAAYVAQQRVSVDTERADAEEWTELFGVMIKERFPNTDLEACNVVVANNVLHEYFDSNGHTDLRVHGFKSQMATMAGKGLMKHVKYDRVHRWCTDPEAEERFIGDTYRSQNRQWNHDRDDRQEDASDLPM
jgi:hypothetical protein